MAQLCPIVYVQHKTIMTIYIIIIMLYYFSGHLLHGKTNCNRDYHKEVAC